MACRPAVSMMRRLAPLSWAASRERNRYARRIRSRRRAGHWDSQAGAPRFQLFRGGGAEGIGGTEVHLPSFFFGTRTQLGRGGGLAAAIHSDEENDFRLMAHRKRRRNTNQLEHLLAEKSLGFFRRARQSLVVQLGNPLRGELHAEIGFNEERFPIDLRTGTAAKAMDELIPKTHGSRRADQASEA